MNVSSWLKQAVRESQVDRLDAELILASCLQQERVFLHAYPDLELSLEQQKQADSYLQRRKKHEALAYILGEKEFYGRKFVLTHDVLIPRPETEELVDFVKGYVASFPAERSFKILDMGTGSGCIIASLACELSGRDIQLTATDISSSALECAQHNIKRLTNKSVSVIKSNLFKSKELKGEKFDIIVANLPYVDKSWPWLDRSSLDYEPKLALYAGDCGLALIKKFLVTVEPHLEDDAIVVLESDLSQHQEILEFCEQQNLPLVPINLNYQLGAGAKRTRGNRYETQALALVLKFLKK